MKSTVAEIRQRFDKDVERFSNLETGQAATMDAPLCMELVTHAAAVSTPAARDLLDIGCGAGNYALKMLEKIAHLNVTLVDLSGPMLERAVSRVSPATTGTVTPLQGDMRELHFGQHRFDIALSAAAFHHLRTDTEWDAMFAKVFHALRPGGSFWMFDFVAQTSEGIQAMMWQRYGEYLVALKGGGTEGEKYRETVFAYVEKEDTPRPVTSQLDAMKNAGFTQLDILHKNSLFAAFGGLKPA